MVGMLCDTVVQSYKYEPIYEYIFDKDVSNKWDETTEELAYKLDGEGNKYYKDSPFFRS